MTDTARLARTQLADSGQRLLLFALLLAILLLATTVRFHRLGEQSLWYDEGVAYAHSQRTLPELIPHLQRNVHLPAYFALLGWWEDLTGSSEFAMRALSALFSSLSVAWTYALGKRLFHPIAGVAAAALVALNSFSIYYAQEARMYAMLAAIAGAGIWLFVGFLRNYSASEPVSMRWRSVLGLGLVNALGIYTHVAYALVILVQVILAVIWLGASWREEGLARQSPVQFRRLLSSYFLANLLTLVLFAPWLPVSLQQVFAQPNLSQTIGVEQILRLLQGYFAFGNTFEQSLGTMGVLVYFFLLLGLLPSKGRRAWWSLLAPVIWVSVSVVIYLYLGLTTRYLRFLLPAQMAFALWIGRGVWILWTRDARDRQLWLRAIPRLAATIAVSALLLTLISGLGRLYHGSEFQRDDVRGLVAQIEGQLGENDAVLLSAAGFQEVLRYYYRSEAPVYGLPTSADDEATRRQVLDIIATHDQLHAIFYGAAEQDPDQVVETTLNMNAFEVSDSWVDDLRYVQYVRAGPLQPATQVNLWFGDEITLRSYALSAVEVKAGDVLQVQLVWTAKETPTQRYKVFLQLLNADGVLVAQRDSEPAGGSLATNSWTSGGSIVDNHALLLPADLPVGDYVLIAGIVRYQRCLGALASRGKNVC